MSEYPTLDPKSLTPLRIIAASLANDPTYLDAEDCPYSPELRDFLRVFGQKAPEIPKNGLFFGENADKWAVLEQEATKLYDEMSNFGDKISDEDVAERMSWFRTSAALLEKVVSINERAVGLKRIHQFQELILDIFATELDPDMRTRIVDRLRACIEEGPND
jgi:hypothetical protein